MNDKLENIIKAAAIASFSEEIKKSENYNDSDFLSVILDLKQKRKLVEKILFLSEQDIFVLFSKYCFNLTPKETEVLFNIQNVKGYLWYCRKLLSHVMGLSERMIISNNTMEQSCKIAVKQYVRRETQKCDNENKIILFPQKIRRTLKIFSRQIVVCLIVLFLSFSVAMAANAEFREKVISWVIETFEKYSIFEIKNESETTIENLQKYKANYIPKQFHLLDTIEQPSLILHQYETNAEETLNILMSLSDTRIYMDTEGISLEEISFQKSTAYFFEKENIRHFIFDKDGYYFAIYGKISKSEILRVAKNIK